VNLVMNVWKRLSMLARLMIMCDARFLFWRGYPLARMAPGDVCECVGV
jgi:hypothetical protein